MDKQLLQAWLKAGYWEKDQLFPTPTGTPQGGLISPLLANLALDGMEQAVKAVAARQGDKINFVRYADDFVVTGATRELLEQKVKPALTAFLQARGLELSEQKTVITHLQTGFDFLGHTVRKYGDKLLIRPAKSKVQILRQKISRLIHAALGLTQEALLRQLNPLLRGWANYYRHGAARQTFTKWTTMSGTNSGAGWPDATPANPRRGRSANTSPRLETQAGSACGYHTKKGESRRLKLYRLASTTIERHLKVQGAANPYDAHYTEYFEKRRCFAWRVRWASRPASTASATQA